jgi:hypothetical protein
MVSRAIWKKHTLAWVFQRLQLYSKPYYYPY